MSYEEILTPFEATEDTEQDTQSELNFPHQACLGCVFAQREGKKQTGCGLGRLEKFKAVDPNLVIEGYNEHGEFFIVNRACNTYRDELWGDRHRTEDLKALALKECQIRTDVLLYIDEDYAEANVEGLCSIKIGLLTSLESLKTQTLKPNKVIVVSNQKSIPDGEIIGLLRAHGGDLNWKLTKIVERDNDEFVNQNRAIDIAFGQVEGQFYAVMQVGDTLNSNLISNINEAINDKLERFSILYDPDDIEEETGEFLCYYAYVVDVNLHKALNGNKPLNATDKDNNPVVLRNLIENAIHLAEATGGSHMIQDIKSVGGGM